MSWLNGAEFLIGCAILGRHPARRIACCGSGKCVDDARYSPANIAAAQHSTVAWVSF